jgi:hypothetical protein
MNVEYGEECDSTRKLRKKSGKRKTGPCKNKILRKITSEPEDIGMALFEAARDQGEK